MTFLPIVERELRIGARQLATYRLRWMFAGAVLIIWLFLLGTVSAHASQAQRGRTLFAAVGIPAFVFALLSGVFLTADSLSQERREGTLGLLFLTNLNGCDVVIGKLIGTSIHAFYGLLAVLPLLSLPLLIGGVSAGQFWRVTLALMLIMLLSLSIGMFVSSFCRETRTALGTSLVLLVVLAGGPPALWALASGFGWGALPDKLLFFSPGFLYGQAQDSYVGLAGRITRFNVSSLITVAMTLLLLIGTSIWTHRAWRDKIEIPATKRARRRRTSRFVSRHEPLIQNEGNPCYWLFCRDRRAEQLAGVIFPVLFLIWICCVPGTFSPQWRINNPCFSMLMFIAFGSHFLLKVYIAIEASRRLNEDRRSGALELLLSTPVTIEDILSAQIRALRDMFNTPILTLCCLNIAMIFLLQMANPLRLGEERFTFTEGYFASMLLLFLDARAISWLAMLLGFRSRKQTWAIFKTLGILIIFPWLCVFLFMMSTQGGLSTGTLTGAATMYYLLTAGFDFIVASGSQQALMTELRECIAAPGTGALRDDISPVQLA